MPSATPLSLSLSLSYSLARVYPLSLSLSLDLFLHPLLRRCVRVYVCAHEALAVFSLVRRGTCQQLTNGRRSPVLALHVDRVYRRVPRFLPLSIDRSTIVPFYRRGKTKNETRRASFVEERNGSIIRVYTLLL